MDLQVTKNGKKNIELQQKQNLCCFALSIPREHSPFDEVTLQRGLPAINDAVKVPEGE